MALRKLNSLRWKILTPIILSLWLFIIGMGWWQIERESDYRTEIVDSQLRLINSCIAAQINSSRPDILNDFFDFIDDYYRQDSLFSAIRINIFNSDWEIVDAVGEPMRLSMAERRGLQDNATIVAAEMLNLKGKPYLCNAMRKPENDFMIISALPDDGYLEQYLSKGRTEVLVIMAILAVVLTIAAYYSSRFYGRNITLLRDFARRSAVDPEFTPGQDFPHDELGDIARQIVSLHTERQHAMAQMRKEHDVAMNAIEEKSLQKRRLTNNINHELKTPITTIMGFSELLANPNIEREKVTDFAYEINKEALRLRDIVGDIIELSSLDEGYETEIEEIDVKSTVSEEIGKLQHKAEENQVTLENRVPSSVTINGWHKVFSDVISNLLDNAIRYNRNGGFVKVESKEIEGKVEISVSDNGIGIPKDSLSRVFERFYRVDKSRSRESGGTGLGLSIVKNGVERMGGEVRVESTQGEGSVFTITFSLNQ